MSRWEPNARGRLVQAALDLFSERGFEQTTVAEIGERAGLTERTFYRYFTDKREVLFGGQATLQELSVNAIASMPATATPIMLIGAALDALAAVFPQEHREFVRKRQAVVAANPELQERELLKSTTLSSSLTEALRQRGIGAQTAYLTAEIATAVFKVAFTRWITETEPQTLSQLFQETLTDLKTILAP